jgi:predicted component of type VI protein secretion system
MRRLFLPLAMVVSLWPIGVIAVGVVNAATTQKPASVNSPGTTVVPARPTDYTTLNRLGQREESLLSRLRNSSALRGVADEGLSRAARTLENDELSWITNDSGRDSRALNVAQQEANVANRAAALAARPSQARFDAFNTAVSAYNNAIKP